MNSDFSNVVKLLQNTDYRIGELVEETGLLITDFSDTNPVLFIFSLLRDNMLSLKSRLTSILILYVYMKENGEVGQIVSEFLENLFEGSQCIPEKVLCISIVTGSISQYSDLNLSEFITQSYEEENREISWTPSLHSICFTPYGEVPEMIFAEDYPEEDQDLHSFALAFASDQAFFLFSTPPFDRPSLSFSPSRDEFFFPSPMTFTPSLLYIPIQSSQLDDLRRLLELSATQPLVESELIQLRNNINCYKGLIRDGNWAPVKFRSIIANNAMIALDILQESLPLQKKQQLLDVLLQPPLSVQIFHVASQMICLDSVPATFFPSFVERSLKNLMSIKDGKMQRHLVQCFCFFLSGVYKKGLINKALMKDSVMKLKSTYKDIPEVLCVSSLLSSGYFS